MPSGCEWFLGTRRSISNHFRMFFLIGCPNQLTLISSFCRKLLFSSRNFLLQIGYHVVSDAHIRIVQQCNWQSVLKGTERIKKRKRKSVFQFGSSVAFLNGPDVRIEYHASHTLFEPKNFSFSPLFACELIIIIFPCELIVSGNRFHMQKTKRKWN